MAALNRTPQNVIVIVSKFDNIIAIGIKMLFDIGASLFDLVGTEEEKAKILEGKLGKVEIDILDCFFPTRTSRESTGFDALLKDISTSATGAHKTSEFLVIRRVDIDKHGTTTAV
jgi:hypothetical protein